MRVFRGKRAWVLLLALVSALPAWASRGFDADERKEIERAIDLVETIWPGSRAARDLRELYRQNRIIAEDRWPDLLYGQTNFPIVGTQTVTINARIVPDPTSRIYTGRFGEFGLFEDRAKLTSVLVHEWYHTTQSWAHVKFQPWDIEPPAWRRQKTFLEAMLKRFGDNPRYRDRLETLIDSVDAELNHAD